MASLYFSITNLIYLSIDGDSAFLTFMPLPNNSALSWPAPKFY